ncbi:MAG: hypothetical protein P4L76_13050 [Beijerinckiaceae bacterium]|nr:hypothetical protein [Beijerinckiaceae bacterium]
MSDHFLMFVPTDPTWQPTKADAERAVELFKSIAPNAQTIEAIFTDDVEFHHPCENWSGVDCAACGADLEDWFYETTDKVYRENHFADLSVTTPCCGLHTSLNDLNFVWPAAFGRFALESMRPGLDTNEEQEKAIAACLGSDLRKVWIHL